ncbi:TM0106 family RecB-like putative nuclease [Fulvivirgaceae bacterium BMA10]|uniref:TM0106 family RecB-like putative nuclease n=1 Tax=Splendidivirga corallicola TaxID=3051826 RepID=A0ABT8KKM7_9BACT|nr:TM0106 family RecB-like putative nuclease [Fulvivirgaceae bacterium BMA10]
MEISDEIIEDFITCRYKAYFKIIGNKYTNTLFEKFLITERERLRTSYLNKSIPLVFEEGSQFQDLPSQTLFISKLKGSYNLKVLFEVQQKDGSKIIPYYFETSEKRIREIKSLLVLKCFFLRRAFGMEIEKVRLITGLGVRYVKLNFNEAQFRSLLKEFEELEEKAPNFCLNENCSWCCFQENCRKKAIEEDHLSLLSSIRSKNIGDYLSKGIFSLKQLSYQFKPRRTRVDAKNPNLRHIPALKALAIRKQTIFVYKSDFGAHYGLPRIYFDVEGYLEDVDKIYLIGVVIERESGLIKKSFWVPNVNNKQRVVYNEFIDCVMYYCPNGANLFYYGSYDLKFLKILSKGIKMILRRSFMNTLIENGFDLLEIFRNKIYLPTYSNELKVITRYLGYEWVGKITSGLEAYAYRKDWEESRDKNLKNELIKYNIQDCLALKVLVDFLDGVEKESEEIKKYKISSNFTEEIQRRFSGRKFGNKNQILPDYNFINDRAYFNYQRDKVYFRESKSKKRNYRKRKKLQLKFNKTVIIREVFPCPHCNSKKTQILESIFHKKLVLDLKIIKDGMKKYLTFYKSHALKCLRCNRSFRSDAYLSLSKYGHTLMSWVIYQHIVNIMSFEKINRMLGEFFDLKVGKLIGKDTCYKFKDTMSFYYKEGHEEIIRDIKNWEILHIDETRAKLRGEYGYVWVFTNMKSVIYMFRSDRTTDFLKLLLSGFEGVLISDFYKGYDSLPCKHQKCLVHLLRDINDLLFKEQQNGELILIANQFSSIMKKIVITIDNNGLRNRSLGKHKKDACDFFQFLSSSEFKTKTGIALKKRLLTNKNRLFTFLNFNDVPWNNNNAEYAIRHFALYRKEVKGIINENGLKKYLILLSLYKTCEYRQINFFKFLLSREKKISDYQLKYTKQGNRRKVLARKVLARF